MVDFDLTVMEAIELETGERQFFKKSETNSPEVEKNYKILGPVPETVADRFLTLSAERARDLKLCEGVVETEEQFLASLQIETLIPTRMTWVDQVVWRLNGPLLTALLLIVGLIGLYLEIAAPGLSVSGLTALLCFGIFFWSHFLGGTAGWLEVLLFGLGVVCLICELFVVPGFGIFGITGIGLVVISLIMASQDFVVPSDEVQWAQLRMNSFVVLGAVLGVLLLLAGQILFLDSLPGLSRFKLAVPDSTVRGTDGSMTSLLQASGSHKNFNVGAEGIADSDLRPAGKVMIDGDLVDVVTEGDYVEQGDRVAVLQIEGNRVVVRRCM